MLTGNVSAGHEVTGIALIPGVDQYEMVKEKEKERTDS